MDLYVGERHIKGDIKRREEARAIYEAARDAGKMAALLDQERPNIFTQHVANIRRSEKVRIIISYVERLKYEDGDVRVSVPDGWVLGTFLEHRPVKPAGDGHTTPIACPTPRRSLLRCEAGYSRRARHRSDRECGRGSAFAEPEFEDSRGFH